MLRKWLRRWIVSGTETADRLIEQGNRAESGGRLREACELYRAALSAVPGYARAHLNLGVALEAAGDAEAALQSYDAALAADNANPFARYNLGKLLYTRGSFADAAQHLRAALERKPDFTDALVVLANALEASGDVNGAMAALERALEQRPDYAGAWYNYGLALKKLGRMADAESALRRVLALDPSDAKAIYQLAQLLLARGALDEAEGLLRRILGAEGQSAQAHAALHEVHKTRGRYDLAAAELEAALKLRPDWGELWVIYADVLKSLQRLPDAEAALRRAIAVDPRLSSAYRLLGSILANQLRIEEAREVYVAGLPFDADGYVEACELFVLNFFETISSEDLFARHKAFGARVEKAHPVRFGHFTNSRDPNKRLRIGYVSGDFREHPVGWCFLPLLERHDRSEHEIYCYSVYDIADELTRQIERRADRWRNVALLPATETADVIHRDGIDLLVDLSGYGGIPTFDIFAYRPAPVQASWIGYLSTTGLTRIDYRITDANADPPGMSDRLHTETVVRLPHAQWVYRAFTPVEVAPRAPCQQNGFVTFGSFNQSAKLSRGVRRLWAEILRRVPASRLVLVGVPPGPATQTILRDFEADGVAPGRISVDARLSLDDYFRRMRDVDIALDSMPYSGGTTTLDLLWMGTPVLTLPASRSVSRSATSILSTVGLNGWIASTPEDYIRRAVEFARDTAALVELRRSLRERMRASALMDEPRFAQNIEAAYRRMWRTWCAAAPGSVPAREPHE
jgi:predicted O-linked N-acetylglucosamine transferase (SPINDLY family)